MKKALMISVGLGLSLTTLAQNKTSTTTKPKTAPSKTTPAKTTPAKPKTAAATKLVVLKNLSDSASYAMGLSLASFYKSQGAKTVNADLVAQAIKDLYQQKNTIISVDEIDLVVSKYFNQLNEESIQPTIDEGASFLLNNGKRPEVKTTASGLQYEVIKEGTGEKPNLQSRVVCHYKGTLLNGEEFDNSYKRGTPITIGVTEVISGWTEGLQLMSVGSLYKFYIPYNLGYGKMGNPPAIPGGSTLIFEVELVEIK